MNYNKANIMDYNKVSFELYKNINNIDYINDFIKEFNINDLVIINNSGFISNVITIYINTNHNIDFLFDYLISNNIKLMKRDYFKFINYYYVDNYDKAIDIFNKFIPVDTLINEDIDYIIDNKLHKILDKLNNCFLCTTLNTFQLIKPEEIKLKKYNLSINETNQILSKLSNFISNINSAERFVSNYDIILDGGNILYNNKGKISNDSLIYLSSILDQIKTQYTKPLLILHSRHFRNKNIKSIVINSKVKYFLTPYKENDDLYTLWFFLKTNCSSYILSNDKYSEHIFKYNINNYRIFKHIIYQQLIMFNKDIIKEKINYSNCIQIDGSNIYIPHISNYFIKIII